MSFCRHIFGKPVWFFAIQVSAFQFRYRSIQSANIRPVIVNPTSAFLVKKNTPTIFCDSINHIHQFTGPDFKRPGGNVDKLGKHLWLKGDYAATFPASLADFPICFCVFTDIPASFCNHCKLRFFHTPAYSCGSIAFFPCLKSMPELCSRTGNCNRADECVFLSWLKLHAHLAFNVLSTYRKEHGTLCGIDSIFFCRNKIFEQFFP